MQNYVKLPGQLKLKYLTLLCVHRPNHLYAALKSFDFPQDEALELVSKYKVRDAMAYLKFRMGRDKEAVKEFKQVRHLVI
jgi:hypothetical protein